MTFYHVCDKTVTRRWICSYFYNKNKSGEQENERSYETDPECPSVRTGGFGMHGCTDRRGKDS